MHRSRFALFLGALVSLIVGLLVAQVIELGRAFIRLDFLDHHTRLYLDRIAIDGKTPTLLRRAKAFMARAFTHDRYSGGRFDLERSTFA